MYLTTSQSRYDLCRRRKSGRCTTGTAGTLHEWGRTSFMCTYTYTYICAYTSPLIIPPHVCQYTPIRWRVQFQGVLLVVDRVQSVDLLESPLKTRALCPVFFLSRLEVSLPLFQTTNLTPDSLPQRIGPEIWIGGLSDAHPRFRALWAQFMYTQ